MEGDGPFDWSVLVPHIVHPLQVAIVEALAWIDVPLSPSALSAVLSGQFPLSEVSYHVRRLDSLGCLEQVGERRVRGWQEKFYFFADRRWRPGAAAFE